ncbi:hypothetical protein EDC04DRAFT_2601326 [Pisolithus marmoratus]|nr:hypothetical protein EDC04DRAFT_2601326 [Pisolithus marmoratus]
MLWSHWLSKLDRNSCSRSGTAPIVILFKQVSILLDISNLLSPIQQPPFWPESSEPVILEPYTHIISKPGKEIRALLRSIQQMALGYPRKHLDVISRVVRMLDSASLMVEDIENGAQLWRELAILRSDDSKDDEVRVVANKDLDIVVTEELVALHREQGLEIFWWDSLRYPTIETGGLFRIAIKLMMACATSNIDVIEVTTNVPLVNLFGMYFRIRDNYVNLQRLSQEILLRESFLSPIVHGVQADEKICIILKRKNSLAMFFRSGQRRRP